MLLGNPMEALYTCKQAAKTPDDIPTCVVKCDLQLMKLTNPHSSSLGAPLARTTLNPKRQLILF